MENTISKELGNLISKNLDLDLFWSICFDIDRVRMIGDYSKATEKYLLKKSFEHKDYIYADDKNKIELENGSIRIVLIKNK
jgi:hypothetical protein